MKIRLAAPLQIDSVVDGAGIRTVLWTQGCSHACPGCHNPGTHDFKGGYIEDTENLKKELDVLEGQDGITLSGGDPLMQIDACLDIVKYCVNIGLNVWCYTGFTFEELLKISKNNSNLLELLQNIDVLVDGRFILEQRSLDILFRGSTNQRILDCKASIKALKPVEIEEYTTEFVFKQPTQSEIFI